MSDARLNINKTCNGSIEKSDLNVFEPHFGHIDLFLLMYQTALIFSMKSFCIIQLRHGSVKHTV